MSFTEKARLAQQSISIVHNHIAILFAVGLLLVIIPMLVVLIYRDHRGHNKIIYWCSMGLNSAGFVCLIPAVVLSLLIAGVSSRPVTSGIETDTAIVRYYRKLPSLTRKNKRDYRRLQKTQKRQGHYAYADNQRYVFTHYKLNNMKHFIRCHKASTPWINRKF